MPDPVLIKEQPDLLTSREHWLDARRVRVYSRLCAAVFLTVSLFWFLSSKNMVDPKGKPLGYDFITYWSAAKLAAAGNAVDAYNLRAIFQVEKQVVPASNGVFAWYYPPTFYLIVLPLAALPYLAAYAMFSLTTLSGYLIVFRRAFRGKEAMWCLAGFSGVWLNLLQGQNGFLTAALAAAGLLCLETRPVLAGVLIGLLAMKPHLALLFPVALIAARAWRTLAVAALTSALFVTAGVSVLGIGTLKASLASLHTARMLLEDGSLPWAKMPTVFAFLRMWGAPITVAYTAHAVVALAAVMAVWRIGRVSTDGPLRGAALMTATFLISPYLFDYDLAWLAFPIGWLATIALRDGWRRGEREVLAAAWLLPFAMAPLSSGLRLQPGPWVLAGLLWAVLARVEGYAVSPKAARVPSQFSRGRQDGTELGHAAADTLTQRSAASS